jgi:hypothetical protein
MDVDPIWQPGSVWPDKADDGYDQQAVVQIYSRQLGRGYITTVPTHGKTNPFIDCYGDEIMWAFLLKYSVLSVLIVIYKIVLIVLYCIDSEPYENDYGVSPKYIIQEENG